MAWNLVSSPRSIRLVGLVVVLFALGFGVMGCGTSSQYGKGEFIELAKNEKTANPKPIVLREGDSLKISFAGAPNLNSTQPIRRDGKINLSIVGEVVAAGLTPGELEKQLIKLFTGELQNKEISVSVESSVFPVFVTGAVLHPGKINSDRPITALEAIMEAGGFDYTKADLKDVKVIRNSKGHVENKSLNLKRVLNGEDSEPFYLEPSDIIYVKEKFTWF